MALARHAPALAQPHLLKALYGAEGNLDGNGVASLEAKLLQASLSPPPGPFFTLDLYCHCHTIIITGLSVVSCCLYVAFLHSQSGVLLSLLPHCQSGVLFAICSGCYRCVCCLCK